MLKILKTSADGHTGHISITAHVVEQVGENSFVNGAEETHGIHPDMLHMQHGGNVKQWVEGIHRDMMDRHEARKKATKALEDLQALGDTIQ